jgi:NAD(P)-dependent dehydrogenase (short-subunit alcohol dehydrogenase family)
MNQLNGRVAFISGVGRGQGRSDAVRLAEEGANIIGFDVCADNPDVEYPMATEEDLAETVRLVEVTGQKMHAAVADVRDGDAVAQVLADGVERFGQLNIVVAAAGVAGLTNEYTKRRASFDVNIAVNLTGVFNTVMPAVPHLKAAGGGAIVIHASTHGLTGGVPSGPYPGEIGYSASKAGTIGLMRTLGNAVMQHNIRVNTLHAGGVDTPLNHNDVMQRHFRENPQVLQNIKPPLPVPGGLIPVRNVSETVLHLVSDGGRFIANQTIFVDAGYTTNL